MNQYKWSAKNTAFFPVSWMLSYESAGWDLSDLVDISDDVYMSFTKAPPDGKTLGAIDGLPGWIELTPLTAEQKKAEAEAERKSLRNIADNEIAWLQDAVDAGIATDNEITELSEWRKYRVLLMRVDTSHPYWPQLPFSS